MSLTRRQKLDLWLGPFLVWVALLALLGLTTWLGYFPLGEENVAANFGIAAIMAALVAVFLMRLRGAVGVVWLAGLAGLMFVFILFLLTFGDYFNR